MLHKCCTPSDIFNITFSSYFRSKDSRENSFESFNTAELNANRLKHERKYSMMTMRFLESYKNDPKAANRVSLRVDDGSQENPHMVLDEDYIKDDTGRKLQVDNVLPSQLSCSALAGHKFTSHRSFISLSEMSSATADRDHHPQVDTLPSTRNRISSRDITLPQSQNRTRRKQARGDQIQIGSLRHQDFQDTDRLINKLSSHTRRGDGDDDAIFGSQIDYYKAISATPDDGYEDEQYRMEYLAAK